MGNYPCRPLAGICIFTMVVITVANGLGVMDLPFNPLWPAGLAAWAAALLLLKDAPRILLIQVAVLLLFGLAAIAYSLSVEVSVDPATVISSNTGLLSMIAAVGFLRLVAMPDTAVDEELPTGRSAYLRTLLGVSAFASFINISAPLLIADRIHRKRPLTRLTAQSIVRVFCSAASWSPFFGAMAVVLTYSPGSQLSWIMVTGFPFMLLALLYVYFEAKFRFQDQVQDFIGYPMHLDGLRIPALLVIAVVLGSWLLDHVSPLVMISLCAMVVTVVVLVLRTGPGAGARAMANFVVDGLPGIVNELVLFLAAGVLAAGISGLVQAGAVINPFDHFDAGTATQLLGVMLVLAAMGIHPVITITSFSPLVWPLDPDPNLLAVTYLFAWHMGTCSSPLSGTNLVFQGRYGIPSWKLAMWNWPYSLGMFVIAAGWLQLVERILS